MEEKRRKTFIIYLERERVEALNLFADQVGKQVGNLSVDIFGFDSLFNILNQLDEQLSKDQKDIINNGKL